MVYTSKRRLASLLALARHLATVLARDVNCACGYLDPVTKDLWTDTTILYFNETDAEALSKNPDFMDLSFTNMYESGYTAIYRQGASNSNVDLETNVGVLQLTVNPSTKQHSVVGGGIRTVRQDIRYGSFRAGLQPAQPLSQGGSALSMYYHFNESQSIGIDVVNGETMPDSTVLFDTALPGAYLKSINFSFDNVSQASETWKMNEWQFDWTPKIVEYSTPLNSSVKFNITSKKHELPSIPGPVFFKHRSTATKISSQGPPTRDTQAYVGYIRMFFNSTMTSKASVFDAQCSILQEAVCSTEDHTLRVSSTYSADSAKNGNKPRCHIMFRNGPSTVVSSMLPFYSS